MTRIKTGRATYNVHAVDVDKDGRMSLRVQSVNGKSRRRLTLKDVGRTRWDSALAHFFATA